MSNITLYELTQEYRALAERMGDMDLPADVLRDTLEGEALALELKATSVIKFAMNTEATVEAIDRAIAAMKARRDTYAERAKWLKGYVLECMQAAGIQKIETPELRIRRQRNSAGAVTIFDAAQIPAEYIVTPPPPPPEISKKLIADAIKAGVEVPGAKYEVGEHLRFS